MRIGWGYKIFFAYSAFVVMILVLVYKANHENFDLVTENYYEAELKYQDVIEQKERVAKLSAPPKITHTTNEVTVQLPAEFAGKAVSGEVYLYRPSDATKDVRKSFTTQQGVYKAALEKELSGLYTLKLSWQCGGQQYFDEKTIFF